MSMISQAIAFLVGNKKTAINNRYDTAPVKRRYEAASIGTTRTSNWLTPATDATSAIVNPSVIRNRARDLVRNNPWANKGLSVIVNNTVGYGIRTQWQSKSKQTAKRTQDLWKAWAESTQCDAQGMHNFYGIQQIVMRAVVESGECLVRLRSRLASDGLSVPFQLQVLEADYLYTYAEGPLANGGYVQHGIEYDVIGRRVAYLIYKSHPGSTGRFYGAFSSSYSRVPANEVIHVFRPDRPGQERGVSWFAPVMIRLRELDIYEDAYLSRQKLANLFAAFIYSDDPSETENDFDDISELSAGSMYTLKPNRRIEFSNPPKADDYGPYTLANLRAIAAGLGITYEALTGDLSQVNFSSARMGWQEFGRSIDSWLWQLLIPQLCDGVAGWFAAIAQITDVTAEWTPPKRMMVDPVREIPAIKDAIRAGLMTQSEAIREQGYDPEKLLTEMASDNALLDKLGLVLDSDPRKLSGQGQLQQTGTTNDKQTNKAP